MATKKELHNWGVNWEEAYKNSPTAKVRWLYHNAYITAKTKTEALRLVKAKNRTTWKTRKWKVYKA